MKQVFLFILLATGIVFTGCGHKETAQKTVTSEPVFTKPVKDDTFVPFTKELYNRLRGYNIDIKKVQFFVDQQLVLDRFVDQSSAEVTSGVVKFINGRYVNEIIIPKYTPCTVESEDMDGFRVTFESGSANFFKFINNRYSPEFYVFSGTNWKDGTADVIYDKLTYRVNCGSCSSAADARLVVKQSDIDNTEKKTKILKGSRVDN